MRAEWLRATARCPNTMAHGPCAGVHPDGSCEVPGTGPCAFTLVEPAGRPYATVPPATAAASTTVPAPRGLSDDFGTDGTLGDPTGASAEAGKALFEAGVAGCVVAVGEIARFSPIS